jgi:tetratricopeptide (TPR) repeat protein
LIRRLLPPFLLLAVLLSACAATRPIPPPAEEETAAEPSKAPVAETPEAPAEEPPKFPVSEPPISLPASAADKAYSDGMAALRDGGYERALELFAAAWKERPGHPGVSGEFDGAVLALKKSGDAAYVQGKLEDAGKRWTGTLRHMNHPAAKPKGYPFTRADVQGQIDRLTAGLMEKGLLGYRKGNIEAAIADWKTILAYDPGNEGAAKAIRTATTQLENLKKLPPAPRPK